MNCPLLSWKVVLKSKDGFSNFDLKGWLEGRVSPLMKYRSRSSRAGTAVHDDEHDDGSDDNDEDLWWWWSWCWCWRKNLYEMKAIVSSFLNQMWQLTGMIDSQTVTQTKKGEE